MADILDELKDKGIKLRKITTATGKEYYAYTEADKSGILHSYVVFPDDPEPKQVGVRKFSPGMVYGYGGMMSNEYYVYDGKNKADNTDKSREVYMIFIPDDIQSLTRIEYGLEMSYFKEVVVLGGKGTGEIELHDFHCHRLNLSEFDCSKSSSSFNIIGSSGIKCLDLSNAKMSENISVEDITRLLDKFSMDSVVLPKSIVNNETVVAVNGYKNGYWEPSFIRMNIEKELDNSCTISIKSVEERMIPLSEILGHDETKSITNLTIEGRCSLSDLRWLLWDMQSKLERLDISNLQITDDCSKSDIDNRLGIILPHECKIEYPQNIIERDNIVEVVGQTEYVQIERQIKNMDLNDDKLREIAVILAGRYGNVDQIEESIKTPTASEDVSKDVNYENEFEK